MQVCSELAKQFDPETVTQDHKQRRRARLSRRQKPCCHKLLRQHNLIDNVDHAVRSLNVGLDDGGVVDLHTGGRVNGELGALHGGNLEFFARVFWIICLTIKDSGD